MKGAPTPEQIAKSPGCLVCGADIEPDGCFCLACAGPLCGEHGVERLDGTGSKSLFCDDTCHENYLFDF